MFYSQSTHGFYSADINGGNIPADAVEITDDQWAILLAGQSQGKVIAADANGFPRLEDPPPPPVVVPDSATAGQVIVWLKGKSNANGNFLTQVDSHCSSLQRGDPIRTAWEREPVFYRDSPTFQGIVQLLQLTPQEVDQGLIEANQITF